MFRYYCSGFDINDAFGHGLGEMFKRELKDTSSILYIPGSPDNLKKVEEKYIPLFTEHFKKIGIEFLEINLLTPNTSSEDAKEMVKNASFIMLVGGDPFKQKELCEYVNILDELKECKGIMLGYSAGAMLMSKYIIITPCSDEYPDFHIEEGLNLDGISIYPHNNTSDIVYPDTLVVGDEIYRREDLIKVARDYEAFYLLQDNMLDNGLYQVSIIKSTNGNIEFYYENDGKIWIVEDEIKLIKRKK